MLTSQEKQGFPKNRISSCVTPFDDKVVLYGGIDQQGNMLNDLWSLCLETKEWTKISTLEPRSGHSGMQINQSIAFIGGRNNLQASLSS
jgi:N-acetylneuraminic acid mutarotase